MIISIKQEDIVGGQFYTCKRCPLAKILGGLFPNTQIIVHNCDIVIDGNRYPFNEKEWNYKIFKELKEGKYQVIHIEIPDL